MSIDLPADVAWLLSVVGLSWPAINEDQVRAFAGHVRTFATGIEATHQSASSTVEQMSAAYSGSSYEQLVATWARMSQAHLRDLLGACRAVATSLDAAADVIVAAKAAAITQLAALAAAFIADQAAASLTFGIAEAADELIIVAARTLVRTLEQQLEQHILSEVIGRAVQPLEHVVQRAVGGLVFQGTASGPAIPAAVGTGFTVLPEQLLGYARGLHGHADEAARHAQDFATAIAGVTFGD